MVIESDIGKSINDLHYFCLFNAVSYTIHFDESGGEYYVEIRSAAPIERAHSGKQFSMNRAVNTVIDRFKKQVSRSPDK